MRRLQARRKPFTEPVKCEPRPNKQSVFYTIIDSSEVRTPDGNMMAIIMKNQREIHDPSLEFIALIGSIVENFTNGARKPDAAQLWFWNDKFWTKAVDQNLGTDYYSRKKEYVLYEIEVENPDELFGQLETI